MYKLTVLSQRVCYTSWIEKVLLFNNLSLFVYNKPVNNSQHTGRIYDLTMKFNVTHYKINSLHSNDFMNQAAF